MLSPEDKARMLTKCPELVTLYPDVFGKKKTNKHRNVKVYEYEDGFVSFGEKIERHGNIIVVFDSQKEYERWHQLRIMQRAGCIRNLDRQKVLVIQEKGEYRGKIIRAIIYKADFCYERDGQVVVEDVKPFDKKTNRYKTTKDFALKWKALKLKYPQYLFELF